MVADRPHAGGWTHQAECQDGRPSKSTSTRVDEAQRRPSDPSVDWKSPERNLIGASFCVVGVGVFCFCCFEREGGDPR